MEKNKQKFKDDLINSLKEHNLLDALLNHLPDTYIYIKGANGRYVMMNKAMLDSIGVKDESEIIGKTCLDLRPGNLAEKYHTDDLSVIESGKSIYNKEERIIDVNGNQGWSLTTKIPLHGKDGSIIGLVGLSKDFTKIKKLSEDLNQAYNELKKLKERQDGDYYLTSLMVKPLISKHIDSKNIKIDFVVDQKKKFSYHDNNGELGGDICIAHTLTLKGRKYNLFTNADAMGKSIQGAGGAIVAGVTINGLVKRSKTSGILMNYSPEEWLKNCFAELHHAYIPFESHMFITAIIGMVDDESGEVFYANCEHPRTVLYRDGKAGFLEETEICRKIGVEDNFSDDIHINRFQMKAGDVIIIGSDGKDNIRIKEPVDDQSSINTDLDLFLRWVEQGQGDLTNIINALEECGELYDDISLLRIEYKPLK